MLNEEQLQSEVKITGGTAIIFLQVVSRLAGMQNGLKDVELKPVGDAREALVSALEESTGVNFDLERARQHQELQQRMAAARAAQQDGNVPTPSGNGAESANEEATG